MCILLTIKPILLLTLHLLIHQFTKYGNQPKYILLLHNDLNLIIYYEHLSTANSILTVLRKFILHVVSLQKISSHFLFAVLSVHSLAKSIKSSLSSYIKPHTEHWKNFSRIFEELPSSIASLSPKLSPISDVLEIQINFQDKISQDSSASKKINTTSQNTISTHPDNNQQCSS